MRTWFKLCRKKGIWILLVVSMLFFQLSVSAGAEKGRGNAENLMPINHIEVSYGLQSSTKMNSEYDAKDIDAVNAMIDNNGLSAIKDSPASWDFVTWDTGDITKKIHTLYLSGKGLTGRLDVSALSGLQTLWCDDNQLEALDLSGTALTFLNCSVNPLTELTGLLGLSNLERLYCYDNRLKTLVVSGLNHLTVLYCSRNQLKTLDVSSLSSLTELTCAANELETLDVSALTNLILLDCSVNQITNLTGLTELSALQDLSCYMNQLQKLDVSGLAELTGLSCYKNHLTELTGISTLSSLQELFCSGNQLKTLNVSGLTELTRLSFYNNQVEMLDVTSFTKLIQFEFIDNPYRSFKTSSGKLTVNAGKGGTVMMTGFNQERNEVILTAVPDYNYLFQSWKGLPEGASSTQSTSFPLIGNIDVSVVFNSRRESDLAEKSGFSEPLLSTLAGEYRDGNGDVSLIIRPEDDRYHVEITIFRLIFLDDGIGMLDEEKIIFTATDASGGLISGEIIETAEGADVIFTNSTWGLIQNGDKFSYYR